MNVFPSIRQLLLSGLFLFGTAGVRAEAPALPPTLATPSEEASESTTPLATSEMLRPAVEKSLAYLDKQGDAWLNEQDCNSCHEMPTLLWSHREAKRRGFTVDETKLAEFVEWADARSKKTGPGLEMTALLKLAMPERPAPGLTDLILKGQQADGSWKPAGQYTAMKHRAGPDATENSTRLFLLALATQEADKEAADTARAKAAKWVETTAPAKTVDTLVFRALYAQRFGAPSQVDAIRAEILKLQNADGGWAYIVGEASSDSLATGEALYALQQIVPETATVPAGAIANGEHWLLSHQREDGGWDIDITRISGTDRSAPEKSKSLKAATKIYGFWGSAWATLGLLQAMPEAPPVDSKAASPALSEKL